MNASPADRTILVLGIETSCDETAAAVVASDGTVLSDVVRSQTELHAPYGGVVPEVASRDHVLSIEAVACCALEQASCTLTDVDGVAVTTQPGLSGALLVGIMAAKGIAWGANKSLIGVDHLMGHLLAAFCVRQGEVHQAPTFPYIGLLVSGGHTGLYRVNGPLTENCKELGSTRDDAVGEAFDKVAKMLSLPYPGGPHIDRLAALGQADREQKALPKWLPSRGDLEFSFSGIKSSIARHVFASDDPLSVEQVQDLSAAFQERVIHILVRKCMEALHQEKLDCLVIGGGVAANRGLRSELSHRASKHGFRLCLPSLASCTDNAAMIAYAGAQKMLHRPGPPLSSRDAFRIGPSTTTALERHTRKGSGPRSQDRSAGLK